MLINYEFNDRGNNYENNKKVLILNLLVIISLVGAIGCNSIDKVENEFDLDVFKEEMKSRGYDFEIEDIEPYFSSNESKTMKIGEALIGVYSYKNNKEMENNAKYISLDGSSFCNGKESLEIDWISKPHFYKKGSIIVNYVGEDEKILDDLKDIFGTQFTEI